MLNLTEEQFFDYINCPALYDFKYNKNIKINKSIKITNILSSISNAYYLYVLNNKNVPSLSYLTKKYESIYLKHKEEIPEKKFTEGLLLLRNFYNWACDEKIIVIESDAKYNLIYKDIKLEGTMNPIAINKNKQLEFLILNYSSRNIDQLELDTKLKYTIDIMSFNNEFKDNKIYGIKYHNVKNNKDLIATRSNIDFERLKSTLLGVYSGIKNNSFYPRESHMCTNCSYRMLCKGWNNN